jgi:hypothetical protein
MGVLRKDGSVDITAQLEGLGFKVGKTVKPTKECASELVAGIFKIESITKKRTLRSLTPLAVGFPMRSRELWNTAISLRSTCTGRI